MPTSNQVTDTNNNNNNKITTGVVVGTRVEPLLGSQTTTTTQASVRGLVTIPNNNNNNTNNNNNNITLINNHQQQQQPTFNSPIKQQQQQQQHEQQQYFSHNNTNRAHNHEQQLKQQHEPARSIEELIELIKDLSFDRTSLSNDELIKLVKNQQISVYKLESFLGKDNAPRCVEVRRDFYRLELAELDKVDQLGISDRAEAFNYHHYEDLEYEKVSGACCENVIGHVKVPVGLAGPLVLDGEEIFVPLATTEGCLVASTCRGLSALRKSGGVSSRVRKDFMTRAPIVRFQDAKLNDALDNVERAIAWLSDKVNKEKMRSAFNLTSSHGKFLNYTMYPVSREIHIRFEAQTGDAMGMNMCSKGVESALKEMQRSFPTMEIVTLSGNMCTDKKAAGINWINGRGKAVECNAELPAHVVQQVFKVSVDSMIDRWKSKVMVGSALAASIGGFNSQAANILTAIFIATGQDPAQNVTSSNCMLLLEKDTRGSLVVCCTMPSIECGTVGGGTILSDQSRYLQVMGVKGPTPKHLHQNVMQHHQLQQQLQQQQQTNITSINSRSGSTPFTPSLAVLHQNQQQQQPFINNINSSGSDSSSSSSSSSNIIIPNFISANISPSSSLAPINSTNGYTNARKLARIICATVMAGELSLLAALTEGTLVKSHMRHNRSSTNVTAPNLSGFQQFGNEYPASACSFGGLHFKLNSSATRRSSNQSSPATTTAGLDDDSAGRGRGGAGGVAGGGGGGPGSGTNSLC